VRRFRRGRIAVQKLHSFFLSICLAAGVIARKVLVGVSFVSAGNEENICCSNLNYRQGKYQGNDS